ncbi:RDD family protein [Tenacibaculum amylolyticum]|uniref:RDD family protein n=1 Tax=Tenacibaculum amylolyticum TaxID=104269 RepID=UPI00389643BF
MDTQTVFNYNLASKKKRLYAFLIDTLFSLAVGYILQYFLFNHSLDDFLTGESPVFGFLFNSLMSLALGAIFYPLFSGNLGHKLLNIKVINAKTGEDYTNFFEGGLREFLKNLSSNLIIPIVWLYFDKKKQNLYDKVSKTYIVEKNKS